MPPPLRQIVRDWLRFRDLEDQLKPRLHEARRDSDHVLLSALEHTYDAVKADRLRLEGRLRALRLDLGQARSHRRFPDP